MNEGDASHQALVRGRISQYDYAAGFRVLASIDLT